VLSRIKKLSRCIGFYLWT